MTQPTRLAEPLKQAEPIPQLIAPQVFAKKSENETRQKAAEMLKAIGEAVEAEKRKKQIGNENAKKEKTECQLIDTSFPAEERKKPEPKQPERVTQKAAETFNTNRTYISEAIKLKDTAPEVFEQVKNGA